MKLVVVSTFWNSEKYISDCINSIKNQYFTNFVCYLVDDMSTDNSYETALKTINGDDRFILIKNSEKKYKAKNFIDVIKHNPSIDWDDVIIEIDGDDKLENNHVFGLLNKIYSNEDVWICGSRWVDKNGKSMKYGRANADNPRYTAWNFSHMRTYRAFLFRSIRESDLTFENEYVKAAVDLAIGIPMLEMSGDEHYYYLDEITYVYTWHSNQSYSTNSSFGDSKLQGRTAKHILSLPKYEKLNLISSGFYTDENEPIFKKSSKDLVDEILMSISDKPINPNNEYSKVDYDYINSIINRNNVYNPKLHIKPIRQNVPTNRNELISIKKGSVAEEVRKMKVERPKSNNLIPNVFGGKKGN